MILLPPSSVSVIVKCQKETSVTALGCPVMHATTGSTAAAAVAASNAAGRPRAQAAGVRARMPMSETTHRIRASSGVPSCLSHGCEPRDPRRDGVRLLAFHNASAVQHMAHDAAIKACSTVYAEWSRIVPPDHITTAPLDSA